MTNAILKFYAVYIFLQMVWWRVMGRWVAAQQVLEWCVVGQAGGKVTIGGHQVVGPMVYWLITTLLLCDHHHLPMSNGVWQFPLLGHHCSKLSTNATKTKQNPNP